MVCYDKLISFHVVERESHKNFITWTYPTISDEIKQFLLLKTFIYDGFLCRRRHNIWIYIEISGNRAIVLLTKEFQINKYKLLCDVLMKKYLKASNPVELVQLYLEVFTTGACSLQENGTLFSCNLEYFKSLSGIRGFIKRFEQEIILIYTAILLKRRVLLFCTDLFKMQQDLLAITNLVPIRNINEYLHPVVDSSRELKNLSFYVAATTDKTLSQEHNLYDLFINLDTEEIIVSHQAKETMTMTKTHKDLALFLNSLSDAELDEFQITQQILDKTNTLLTQLKSLASVTTESNVKMITINDLKAKKYNQTLENFLFNLAIAENIMIL